MSVVLRIEGDRPCCDCDFTAEKFVLVGAQLDLREVEVDEEEEGEEEEEGLGVENGIENVGYEKYDENCVHFDF